MKTWTKNSRLFSTVTGILLTLCAVLAQAQTTSDTAVETFEGAAIPPLAPEPTEEGLRFNFRGVPLDAVLDYMSRAAGFVIIRETDVRGTVDVLSHQPLDQEEAVMLLNTILNQKGLAAIRNERTLTIVKREEARTRDLPVRMGSDPEVIPRSDEMVIQIIPVKYADVTQLIQNMEPLLPTYATLSANPGSNAVILTDTQTNIRRMAEIVRALDTSISEISRLKVFPLEYADAEEVAQIINEIFEARSRATTDRDRDRRTRRVFGPFGPPGGDNQQDATQSRSAARQTQALVVAVADERTNSVVVSAPDEIMPVIEQMIKEIDAMKEDITELRVFPLRYADAEETAKVITDIFEERAQSTAQDRPRRFGGGPFGAFGPPSARGQQGGSQSSERKVQEETVVAVADTRTNSVIIRAASEIMSQIDVMIKQLDTNPAKDKKVFVYSLDNANIEQVSAILQGLFGGQDSRTRTTQSGSTQSGSTQTRGTSGRGTSGGGTSGRGATGGGATGTSGFGSLRE